MPRHKYKGYINDGRPLKIAFDLDGDDTPQAVEPLNTEASSSTPIKPVGKGLRFISFGSGSSGNCAYVGTPRGGILIDAGIREPVKYHRKKKNPERQDVLTLDQAFAVLAHNGSLAHPCPSGPHALPVPGCEPVPLQRVLHHERNERTVAAMPHFTPHHRFPCSHLQGNTVQDHGYGNHCL